MEITLSPLWPNLYVTLTLQIEGVFVVWCMSESDSETNWPIQIFHILQIMTSASVS
jgi:hypothetical protein